jgi:hypothetical protein
MAGFLCKTIYPQIIANERGKGAAARTRREQAIPAAAPGLSQRWCELAFMRGQKLLTLPVI